MRRFMTFPGFSAPLLVAFMLTGLAGCGTSVEFTRLRSAPPAKSPRGPAQIEIFMARQPERRFIEVGLLEARRESVYSPDETPEIIEAMRIEAAAHGCDGLIIVGSSDKVVGSGWAGPTSGGAFVTTLKGFRASCIVFPEER
jgi:hypothetical protein